jgi:cellulose biosynthesis protein BcsQ
MDNELNQKENEKKYKYLVNYSKKLDYEEVKKCLALGYHEVLFDNGIMEIKILTYIDDIQAIGQACLKLLLKEDKDKITSQYFREPYGWIQNAMEVLTTTLFEMDHGKVFPSLKDSEKNINRLNSEVDKLEALVKQILDAETENEDIKVTAANLTCVILALPRYHGDDRSLKTQGEKKAIDLFHYLLDKLETLDGTRTEDQDVSAIVKAIFDGVIMFFTALPCEQWKELIEKKLKNRESRWSHVRLKTWGKRILDELEYVNKKNEFFIKNKKETPKPDELPLVISAHSYRGGTGKSTILYAIALYLLKKGKNVLVIDFDILNPSWFFWLNEQNIEASNEALKKPSFINSVFDEEIKKAEESLLQYSFESIRNQAKQGELYIALQDPSPTAKEDAYKKQAQADRSDNFQLRFRNFLKEIKKNLKIDAVLIDTSPSFYGQAAAVLKFSIHNQGIPLFISTFDFHDLSGIVMEFDILRKAVESSSPDSTWIINRVNEESYHKVNPWYISAILKKHPGLSLYSPEMRPLGPRFWMGMRNPVSILFSKKMHELWEANTIGIPNYTKIYSTFEDDLFYYLKPILKLCAKRLNEEWADLQ